MDFIILQSMLLMAIDCVIFNDKLAGTSSVCTRTVLINKYKFYFSPLIYNDDSFYITTDHADAIINNIMAQELYRNHGFLILQCKKAWFYENEFVKFTDY